MMDVLLKATGLVLVSACAALMIRRTTPELSLTAGICTVAVVMSMSIPLLRPLEELRETARSVYGTSDLYLLPVIKCCAAAVTARIASDLCREAAQNAAASAIELIGVLCAIGAAMPLMRTMMDTIGEML